MKNIILQFGKHKGKPINNTPCGYQYWLIKNCEVFLKQKYPDIWNYLEENKEHLKEGHRASIPDWFDLIDFD